jgi:hypothetical protein
LQREQNIAVNIARLPKFCSITVSRLSILFHVLGAVVMISIILPSVATLVTAIRLFNPRRDNWEKHFKWNSTKTRVIGLTAIGRATIAALQLNSARQIEARILWRKAGQFF